MAKPDTVICLCGTLRSAFARFRQGNLLQMRSRIFCVLFQLLVLFTSIFRSIVLAVLLFNVALFIFELNHKLEVFPDFFIIIITFIIYHHRRIVKIRKLQRSECFFCMHSLDEP